MKNLGTLFGEFELKHFDSVTTTEAEYQASNAFVNVMAAESEPELPPRSLEYTVQELKSLEFTKTSDIGLYSVWKAEEVVASLYTDVSLQEDNPHLMSADIKILPAYRRQGIATVLLETLLEVATKHGRRLAIFNTDERVPSGAAFAKALGADAASQGQENQLVLEELPDGLTQRWIGEADTKASDYTLGIWEGAFPEAEIESIAVLMEVMNTAPKDDLEMEDWCVTPEMLREDEDFMNKQNGSRWVYYARHEATGEYAGYTEMYFEPDTPETAWQGDTGVVPEHRGHAIGRWLKASMLEKIQRERPEITRVRTGNADSNAPMLAINHALGFKPYKAWTDWQVSMDQITAYLKAKRE